MLLDPGCRLGHNKGKHTNENTQGGLRVFFVFFLRTNKAKKEKHMRKEVTI